MTLSKITASSNIISASRISNNRLWDFFKNENIANNKQSNNVLILLLMNLLIIYVNLLTHPNERFYQMLTLQYNIWIYYNIKHPQKNRCQNHLSDYLSQSRIYNKWLCSYHKLPQTSIYPSRRPKSSPRIFNSQSRENCLPYMRYRRKSHMLPL